MNIAKTAAFRIFRVANTYSHTQRAFSTKSNLEEYFQEMFKKYEQDPKADPETLAKLKKEIQEKYFKENNDVTQSAAKPKQEKTIENPEAKTQKTSSRKEKAKINLDSFSNFQETRKKAGQTPRKDTAAEKIVQSIPINFVIKNLAWPPTNSAVLVLGVERRNSLHSSFMADLITESDAKMITVQLSPDDPVFIRTKGNYRTEWKEFVQGKLNSKFLISTNPGYLSDVIFDDRKIKFLVEGAFVGTPEVFDLGPTFVFSRKGKISDVMDKDYEAKPNPRTVDAFFTPFLLSYNNMSKKMNINICDVPELRFRDFLVRSMSKAELLKLLRSYIDSRMQGDDYFEVSLLRPELFIKPRVKYMAEILRQSCYVSKKIIAVVDRYIADELEAEWMNLGPNILKLEETLQVLKTDKKGSMSFSDYIEKQVILDLIRGEYLYSNYIKFKTWPFNCDDTLGYHAMLQSIFVVWDHFKAIHGNFLKKVMQKEAGIEEVKKDDLNIL